MIWAAVVAGSIGCYLTKLMGFLLPTHESTRFKQVSALLPVALLAALVAVQTFAQGSALMIDARLAGLGLAVIALLLRAPFLVVVFVAALGAAVLRSAGLAT
jgi:uncharacterized membrane protein